MEFMAQSCLSFLCFDLLAYGWMIDYHSAGLIVAKCTCAVYDILGLYFRLMLKVQFSSLYRIKHARETNEEVHII